MSQEQYPIGQFQCPSTITPQQITAWIEQMKALPQQLETLTASLSDKELSYRYRKNGWTIRQLVHHIADSHMNSYIRFKLALTEDEPTIKPYAEDQWAKLADSALPIAVSLACLDALHTRWAALLESLTADQLSRCFIHPDTGKIPLQQCIGLYAWHGAHHVAHIEQALQYKI
ncbi:YfiT family bacillithiol transferase [Metasolibacillus sp.]|uniref:YfiT family bacillithiol transferase n=1 Tax=Metasolibacillus sp. TaxID=2703680 RepID=UPI0025EC1BA9|nr:putative metal-dependent hydrolase [Metasolibacillus sp.]MCT6923117.1 putative metal-dependent hydrolase [Metasolibacillus sp.]MCT6939578.1 putative metal-dependent hydrolase [Metasolibacillus sp.]